MFLTPGFKGFVNLSNQGLLSVKGPDAQTFLQGQVTCDLNILNNSFSTLGAHCTHKGRMLFSFRACSIDSDTIGLNIFEPLLEDALAALKKYSIFSKVDLINANQNYHLVGYIGTDTSDLISLFPQLKSQALPQGQALHSDNGTLIKMTNSRYECWLTTEAFDDLSSTIEMADSSTWTAFNIIDGIGDIRPETVEMFIPQMLNFQSIEQAISFNKGCYTGQEVVARMQYLGKLKRHMYRFSTPEESPLQPGTPIYSPDKKQSIGNIVISSIVDDQQQLLAVVTEEAVKADLVYLDQDCHKKLQVLTLPYAITKE